MKGLYFDGRAIRYSQDLEKPVPGDTESLIRILLCGICNTDREVLNGYRPDFTGIMGHEFVGVVEASSDQAWIGKTVVGELNAGCGHCLYCRTGREKHCPERRVIGMEKKDGCFAQYMTLETHLLHEVPGGLPPEVAVFTEPLAAALEIPNQVHIKPDQNVAILGDGRLAYMIASVLSLSGADLTILGKHEEKLRTFEGFGRTNTCAGISPEENFQVVVDATGSPEGLKQAAKLVRRQGTIVMKSTYAGQVSADMSYFVVNEITLVGSRCGPFEPALGLLGKGLVKLPEIKLYDLCDYGPAFDSHAFKAGFSVGI